MENNPLGGTGRRMSCCLQFLVTVEGNIALWRAPRKLVQTVREFAARERLRTLDMKRKRRASEQMIKKLREAATLPATGQGVEEVCKRLEVSPPTWRLMAAGIGRSEGIVDQATQSTGVGKVVGPARKREAVAHLEEVLKVRRRRALKLIVQARST